MAVVLRERIIEAFSSGILSLGLGLGAELGLFKIIADFGGPFTARDLAKAGNFKERYILEWLNAMACGKIIDYDAESDLFSATKDCADCLTGVAPIWGGLLAVLGQRHKLLKDCFKSDGPEGIDQTHDPDFGIWLDSMRDFAFPETLDNMVLSIPGLSDRLESGICVAVGKMASLLAKRFPNSSIWALDIDKELLKVGHERAVKDGLENIHFEPTDLHNVQESLIQKFDYVFCHDLIHDLPFPKEALGEMYKILKSDGIISVIEPNVHSSLRDNINNGRAKDDYIKSLYICMTHSLSCHGGDGWGRSMGKERARTFLRLAGFTNITIKVEGVKNHFICRR